jgi:AcrR family transcriptional regulator
MSTKGDTTRGRLLAAGLDTISVDGLSGITLGSLASTAGLSKSGLFAHFASKEDLQLQLLDEMTRVAQANVVGPSMTTPPGLPRLRALFERWLGWPSKAGLSGGCPIAAAIFEVDDLDGPVRDRVVELDAHWRALLTSLVTEAVKAGHLARKLDVQQFVWEMSGIYLAHHASSRLGRDPISRRRALTAFAALLERAGPSTRTR